MSEAHSSTLVGWREWVRLPEAGVPWVKAKLDTGARTSALHAFDVREFQTGGEDWVRYSVHPWQRSASDATEVTSRVHDQREVRSSSGHLENRIVVLMNLRLAEQTVTAELSLSKRDEMGFRMLIGREALRQGFLVDPGRSYLGGRPPRRERRKNRGL